MSVHRAPMLSAGTEFSGALLAMLDRRWEKYRREFMRCRRKCSEKAVHDFRVAIRRLLSTIDLILIADEDPRLRNTRRVLKEIFRKSGSLRDLQVQLVRLEKMRDAYPELEQFYTLLLLREQRLLKSMDKQLRKVPQRRMDLQMREVRPRLRDSLRMRSVVAETAATGIAASRFLKSVSLLDAVDPGDARTIHELRLAFKKFRYMAESLQDILPGVTHASLKAMNQYQVRMGAIQDNEVFSSSFRQYLSRVRKGSYISFLPVQQELAREHQALVRDFLDRSADLHGFWSMEGSPRGSDKEPMLSTVGVH